MGLQQFQVLAFYGQRTASFCSVVETISMPSIDSSSAFSQRSQYGRFGSPATALINLERKSSPLHPVRSTETTARASARAATAPQTSAHHRIAEVFSHRNRPGSSPKRRRGLAGRLRPKVQIPRTYRRGGLYPSFSTVDIHIRQGEGAIEPHNRVLFASDITRRPCVTERMPLAHHNMITNSETGVFGRLAGIYESRTLCRTRQWKVMS